MAEGLSELWFRQTPELRDATGCRAAVLGVVDDVKLERVCLIGSRRDKPVQGRQSGARVTALLLFFFLCPGISLFVRAGQPPPSSPASPARVSCLYCHPLSWLLTVNDKMYPSEGSVLDFNSSSGGIIQRNVIYSLLVSLTHDLIHLTRLPWRPLKGNKR